ncbi:MAG: protein kinase [Polyangiaceae bacterium]
MRSVQQRGRAHEAMDEEGPYKGGDFSGRYPVIKAIGQGGMAVVYEVFDIHAEERRALKVVHPKFKMNQKILDRTLAEARAGIALRHPNLVRVYEVGTDGDNLCVLMELLEGKTLKQLLDREGRLPLAEAVELCAQIADAIHALHVAGILHRDIKPENIFITRDGEVKILDLGAAKYLKENPNTTEGNPMGTPLYMSAEHLNGINVDFRTDVFSIGHILYYCIAGHHALVPDPSNPPVLGQIVSLQLRGTVTPLTKRVPGLPEVVWLLVAKALEKDRERRYATSDAFAKAMRATLEWLGARGLLQAGDRPRRQPPHEAGDPRRSIVHVVRPGEHVPSNLPYVSTAEGSPSLTSARDAKLLVQAPDPGAAPATGSHGTEILELASRPAMPSSAGGPRNPTARVFEEPNSPVPEPRLPEATRPATAPALVAPPATGDAVQAAMRADEARVAALATVPPTAQRTVELGAKLFLSYSETARCAAARLFVAQADQDALLALLGGLVCELEVSVRLRGVLEEALAGLAPELSAVGAREDGGRPARVRRLGAVIDAMELAYAGEPIVLDALLVALQLHPFVEVRSLAAQALARIGDERCDGLLEKAERREADRHVLGFIAEARARARRSTSLQTGQGPAEPLASAQRRRGPRRPGWLAWLDPRSNDDAPPLWLVLVMCAGALGAVVSVVYFLLRMP